MITTNVQYITNGSTEAEILAEAEAYVAAGGKWLQLRMKSEQLDHLKIAEKVKAICQNKCILIINDRVKLAKNIDADGVHLGLDDMPIHMARELMGRSKIIGGTANTKADCQSRVDAGADYIGLGPYSWTSTKKELSPVLGLSGYEAILKENWCAIPVFAIGGIKLADIPQLMALKDSRGNQLLSGIAVSGLIKNSTNKQRQLAEINELIFKNA